ncbi:MAG TPA: hypothetical protein VNY35_06635 [Solirubrobacteraceae bacterium]|jgi:hypothetical protein|nr:hypothetical protein [Solirubrobacteraceae bacterium]
MGEEIELAAKSSAEVITALTEASGALGPSQEFWGALTNGIHYHFYPRVVKQAMAAAEKIEQSGLPRRAYSGIQDRLLRAILEGGSLENDEGMQARWANLLANALTESPAEVHVAFPGILSDLTPGEAAFLDALPAPAGTIKLRDDEADFLALANLTRLQLVDYKQGFPLNRVEVLCTPMGWAFLQACRAPQRGD